MRRNRRRTGLLHATSLAALVGCGGSERGDGAANREHVTAPVTQAEASTNGASGSTREQTTYDLSVNGPLPPTTSTTPAPRASADTLPTRAEDGCWYTTEIAPICRGVRMLPTDPPPEKVRVCNACIDDTHCTAERGGRCTERPSTCSGRKPRQRVCVYPSNPCAACATSCKNVTGPGGVLQADCAREQKIP